MTIEFNENTVGLWFIPFEGKDWMCGVTCEGERRYKIDYRFRYYHDPIDPWDGKDRKSWYTAGTIATRDEVIAKMREMAAMLMYAEGSVKVYECVRSLDEPFEAFMDRFMKMPFIHHKQVSEEEYREKYGDADHAREVPPDPTP